MLIISAFGVAERKISGLAQWLIATYGFTATARMFVNLFLAAYFLRITSSLAIVSEFFICLYATFALVFLLIGNAVKNGRGIKIYRVGILAYAAFFLIIILLGENSCSHVLLLGIVFGIADALYWLPYHIIRYEINTPEDRVLAFGAEKSLDNVLKIISPIFIGYILSKSYLPIFILLVVCTGIAFGLSYKIPDACIGEKFGKINFRKFVESVAKNNVKIKAAYSGELLRGLNYIGALETTIQMMIFITFTSEFTLGKLTSGFAVAQIFIAYLVGKLLPKELFKNTVVISAGLLFLSTILMVLKISEAAIVFYGAIFAMTVPTLNILQTSYSFNVMEKKEYRVEHMIAREFFRNTGRVLGFAFLALISTYLGGELNYWIRVTMGIMSVTILFIAVHTKKYMN